MSLTEETAIWRIICEAIRVKNITHGREYEASLVSRAEVGGAVMQALWDAGYSIRRPYYLRLLMWLLAWREKSQQR